MRFPNDGSVTTPVARDAATIAMVTAGDAASSAMTPVRDAASSNTAPASDGGGQAVVKRSPLRRIEPGTFVMGMPPDGTGLGDRVSKQVRVTLTRPFEIGSTELTREQWVAEGWALPRRSVIVGQADCREPNCPVTNINFFDAVAFTNHYSERSGLTPCYDLSGCTGKIGLDFTCTSVMLTAPSAYDCEGYRLPMEAEWEFAARAGTSTHYYSGDITSARNQGCQPEPQLEDIAWYCHNSGERAHPVGQKRPNALGLFDMLGNVKEWCNDVKDGRGYGEGPLTDPKGTLTPDQNLTPEYPGPEWTAGIWLRVVRGGSHFTDALGTAAGKRSSLSSVQTSSVFGMRLARTLSP
ncbi:MAG: SUMF1/EgtB/PvdO family nonheme iron enzyme [Myxococcales bacterium]|nr:SUMF1/EgtB/PvdO family nonheme iron enzyme [Myxococcales bacterium]